MKTREVIKNINQCKRTKPKGKDLNQDIARIIKSAASSKREYLHAGFMEEAEGDSHRLPPPEFIQPIF